MKRALLTALFLLLPVLVAGAVPDGWLGSLDEGKKAARTSGKPILVVTAWAPNI